MIGASVQHGFRDAGRPIGWQSSATVEGATLLPGMSTRGISSTIGDQVQVGVKPATQIGPQWKQKVWNLVEDQDSGNLAYCISLFLLLTIVVSILCFILETVESLRDMTFFWKVMDVTTTVIFSVEYATRLWVCNVEGGVTRWQFIRTPMNILDVLAILPGFIDIVIENVKELASLRVFRCVRLVRLFRIFKLGKYASGMNLMVTAVTNALQPLSILMFFISVAFILFSSLLYYAEKMSCPDFEEMRASGTFGDYARECVGINGHTLGGVLCCNERGQPLKFPSIISTLWWTIVTMTTVGYGDIVPYTVPGRVVAGIAMLCGILLISLPVAIVGSKFQEAYSEYEQDKEKERAQRAEEYRSSVESVGGASLRSSDLDSPRSSGREPRTKEKNTMNHLKDRSRQSLKHIEALKDSVLKLRSKKGLSGQASEQVGLLLELFTHIERVEHQMDKLHSKDMDLQRSIRCDFDTLCNEYDGIAWSPPHSHG